MDYPPNPPSPFPWLSPADLRHALARRREAEAAGRAPDRVRAIVRDSLAAANPAHPIPMLDDATAYVLSLDAASAAGAMEAAHG